MFLLVKKISNKIKIKFRCISMIIINYVIKVVIKSNIIHIKNIL